MHFDTLWNELQNRLSPGIEIKNWTVHSGFLGDTFTILRVYPTSIEVDSPGAKNVQVIPQRDFEIVHRLWPDYLNRTVRRSQIVDLTRFSKYILGILHYLQTEEQAQTKNTVDTQTKQTPVPQDQRKAKQVSNDNRLNPSKGKQFQEQVSELISKRSQVNFHLDYPIAIGNPPKNHKFDLVSSDLRYIGECKNYSWTKSGNVPSAKMGFVNEAVFYLSFLSQDTIRFVALRKDVHPRRDETLADYYYRTNRHLLQGVLILEIDLENDTIRNIGDAFQD